MNVKVAICFFGNSRIFLKWHSVFDTGDFIKSGKLLGLLPISTRYYWNGRRILNWQGFVEKVNFFKVTNFWLRNYPRLTAVARLIIRLGPGCAIRSKIIWESDRMHVGELKIGSFGIWERYRPYAMISSNIYAHDQNSLSLMPNTPAKCKSHCQSWEIGMLWGRWQQRRGATWPMEL